MNMQLPWDGLEAEPQRFLEVPGHVAHAAIQAGLPFDALVQIATTLGVGWQGLGVDVVGVSARTLSRRRAEGRFSRVESDRVYRLGDLVALALVALESTEAVARFFAEPCPALGDVAPVECALTAPGSREIERVLSRLLQSAESTDREVSFCSLGSLRSR